MVMVNYNTNNLEVDAPLQALCEKKINTLQKFFQKYTDVAVDVEFHKDGASKSGKQYRVGVNLLLDGERFYASATEESFEQAIDEVRDELDKELRRANDKKTSVIRRGGRALKSMLRFGK